MHTDRVPAALQIYQAACECPPGLQDLSSRYDSLADAAADLKKDLDAVLKELREAQDRLDAERGEGAELKRIYTSLKQEHAALVSLN